MLLIAIALLLMVSVYAILYQFRSMEVEKSHLPTQAFNEDYSAQIKYPGMQPKTWQPFSKKYKKVETSLTLPLDIRRKLIKAGTPMGLLEFLGFVVLSVIFFPTVLVVLLMKQFSINSLIVIGIIVGFLVPFFWLNRKIKIRQHQIAKDLPNIIDLLNLCVSAGLDFMLAVNRIVRDLRPCDLTMELAEVYRETQMGATRKDALKNMAWRIDMPDIYSFVRTLVQADRMGTPIGEALKLQAEEIRVRRFQRGEAMAMKAPIKLLLPLFAFILPVVLIVVAGPILLGFIRGEMRFGF